MGIVGTVASINEQTIVIKTGEGSKIEMLKTAITEVKPETEEVAKKAEASE
jgi:preprotein translocase subunit YajC